MGTGVWGSGIEGPEILLLSPLRQTSNTELEATSAQRQYTLELIIDQKEDDKLNR